MSAGLEKCCKIRHIVRLVQMLRRWRQKAAASRRCVPSDVPAGHIAVAVGRSGRRFIVRASHLNHPVFKRLLVQAEEEYGFANQHGPLAIPCDEILFEEILRFLNRFDSSPSFYRLVNLEDLQRNCHVGVLAIGESRPLLSQKSVW